MTKEQRPVNPEALKQHAVAQIRASIGQDTGLVWRYYLLVPVEEGRADGSVRQIATNTDIENLEAMLAGHFGGLSTPTVVPSVRGLGARDPQKPQQTRELNRHVAFMVYAAPHGASDRYFLALRRELEEALLEGVILVERQEGTIL
jgi:hypothetical protein